jgi:hypothetical protein
VSGAFAVVGFLRNAFGTASPQRAIFFPMTDDTGAGVTDANGQAIYQAVDGYIAISEEHHDETQITDHPVEQGATISDHAYRMPSRLRMRMGWSGAMAGTGVSIFGIQVPTLAGVFGLDGYAGSAFLQSVYAELLGVQSNRELLTIYTGKRSYTNMLIATIDERTTQETENVLILDVMFREIILVNTQVVQAPLNAATAADPQTATPTTQGGTKQLGTSTNYNDAVAPEGVVA